MCRRCSRDIERRVAALPGAFDAALARKQVVAVNAMAVAMQARNLRRVTDRALTLIEARLAALMPANPPGRPPQPAGKPDGQPAGSDAAEPDRVQAAAPMPADPAGRPSQPAGKPDGQPAGSDAARRCPPARPAVPHSRWENLTVNRQVPMPQNLAACRRRRRCPPTRPAVPRSRPGNLTVNRQVSDAREPDRAQLPSARTMRDIRAAHPDPADKHALRERMDRLENRGARVSRRALIAEVRREPADAPEVDGLPEPVADTRPLPVVHHADVDEHPLDSGSVDAVAMYAPDAQGRSGSLLPLRRDGAAARGRTPAVL